MNRPSEKAFQKKLYQPPKLLVYGNLTDMTNASGMSGHRDGGGKGSGTKRYTGK
jgi:hypothetical protein